MNRRTLHTRHDANSVTTIATMSRTPGILLVEDGRLLRRSLTEALSLRGFSVWPAEDGYQAKEIFQEHRTSIDLVLCDLNMPGLNGHQTIDALREIDVNIRFCFMTGDWRADTFNQLLLKGALHVFMKPFPSILELADDLWTLVSKMLNNPHNTAATKSQPRA